MKKRKILLINTYYKERSTGSTCYDIVQNFNNANYECKCLYFVNPQNYENALYLGNEFEQRVHSLKSHLIGLEGYSSNRTTNKVIKFMKEYQPDVVHIFVVHSHILNFKIIFECLDVLKCKVLLHFDDCWWFTGKCVHPIKYKCEKFCDTCMNCPALHDSPNSFWLDFSTKMQKDKYEYINSIESLRGVAVSQWVSNQAKRSKIFKAREVMTLNNWIDDSIFNNKEKTIPYSNKLLFVSSIWPKDGAKYYNLVKLYEILKNDFEFTVVGDTCGNNMLSMQCVGVINDSNQLATIYKENDIYVHLSEFDTFGKVIMESLFCGTPVVAFNNTVMEEVVGNCGVLAKNKDIEDLANCIKILFANYDSYINNIVSRDFKIYTKKFAMNQLKEMYKE